MPPILHTIYSTVSNPLVMSAGVSRNVKMAMIERPMHRISLRVLQKMVDEMVEEVLHAQTLRSDCINAEKRRFKPL